jgi:glycosyltransferase involved in cell wall biosynthesis
MVMPNPFDMPPVRRGQLPSVRTILFAGRIEREKGVFDLIEAFREVHRVLPDVRLVLAGDGKTAEAESMVRQLRLSDCVEFPGWLGENALAERYSQASVFCLPSYIEGMPIAVLQSMAAGVPVVASAVGGICDVLQAGAGLTVAPGDIEDLARQLIRVLIDPDLQRRLAAAGREALCAYKADSVNKRIESVYQDLLTGTAKPHPAFHGV